MRNLILTTKCVCDWANCPGGGLPGTPPGPNPSNSFWACGGGGRNADDVWALVMLSFTREGEARRWQEGPHPTVRDGPPRVHLQMQLCDSILCAPWGPQQNWVTHLTGWTQSGQVQWPHSTGVQHSRVCFYWLCLLSRFSHVWLSATPWTMACQAPLSMGFSRQEYWSGLLFPSPFIGSW